MQHIDPFEEVPATCFEGLSLLNELLWALKVRDKSTKRSRFFKR
jgi:hypothetical protein